MASFGRSAAAAARSAALRSRTRVTTPFPATRSPVSPPSLRRSAVTALAGAESLMPLHSAVAGARLRTCIAADSSCWSCPSRVSWQAVASDPSPLQDFCVADNSSRLLVNGFVCKDPKDVKAEDFFLAAKLDMPREAKMNKVDSNVTLINATQIPGLNTFGISLARIDYAPLGENPPHTHPRATEILTVLEGTLYVGFVTSNPENKLFSKVLTYPIRRINFSPRC